MGSASRRIHGADVLDPALEVVVGDDPRPSPGPRTVSPPTPDLIRRLKDLTELDDAQLAELLGCTPADLRRWSRDRAMDHAGAEHLRAVLETVEIAAHRYGTAERTRLALLSPVGPGRPRPFDYLRDRSYLIAGGFLQVVPESLAADWESRRTAPTLPRDVRLAALEDLSPTPRFELDEDLLS